MILRRLTALALLWASGCCVPGGETYRPESRVVVHGEPAAERVVACTWSSWHSLGAPAPCDDVAVAEPAGSDWRVPWFGSRFVTVIFGEAPLMQTVYVACAAGSPIGATFIPWNAVARGRRRDARGAGSAVVCGGSVYRPSSLTARGPEGGPRVHRTAHTASSASFVST